MTRLILGMIVGLAALGGAVAGPPLIAAFSKPAPPPTAPEPSPEDNSSWVNEPLQPLPTRTPHDPRKVALGRRLFLEARLSHDKTISCASCHNLERGGADNKALSIGVEGQVGDRNAPTVFNVAFNFRQFWDGRADTLEHQVEGPLLNPREMKSSWQEILKVLREDPSYKADFAALFPGDVDQDQVTACLAAFLRSLVTISRFDHYLRGKPQAITEREKLGYETFKRKGCVTCHQGSNAGGNLFSKFGAMGDYFADRGLLEKADLGRYGITGKDEDKDVFKVPSLRNVALTAPYFHNGSVATLEEAVGIMGQYQLGKRLSTEEVGLIVDFLKSLSGISR